MPRNQFDKTLRATAFHYARLSGESEALRDGNLHPLRLRNLQRDQIERRTRSSALQHVELDGKAETRWRRYARH